MAKKRSLVKLEKVRNADYLKLENFKEIPLVVLDHYNHILSIFCFSLFLCQEQANRLEDYIIDTTNITC